VNIGRPALAGEGTLRPVIDRVLPLEQVAEAMALVESGQARGKVVLAVGDQEPGRS
jgi:NADPH:quinone reductase-like Zn-dependent oxidoreductase